MDKNKNNLLESIRQLVILEAHNGRLYLDEGEIYTNNIFTQKMKELESLEDKKLFKSILFNVFKIQIV